MALVKVTPINPDVPVRKENGAALKPEGENLERSVWWLRREKDGDVTLADPTPVSAQEESPAVKETAPDAQVTPKAKK